MAKAKSKTTASAEAAPAGAAPQTYKFAQFREEARAITAVAGEPEPMYPPFVIDDVEPPIVITAPDTLERQLQIAELIGDEGTVNFTASQALPLLRALCGPAFPRVWALIRHDKDPQTAIALVQALTAHMYGAIEGEANETPGGSQGSSD